MKTKMIVITTLMALLMIMSGKSVFASDTNVLLNRPMGISALTDGNLSSMALMKANVHYKYTFENKSVDINVMKIYRYDTAPINVILTKKDGSTIEKKSPSQSISGLTASLVFNATNVTSVDVYIPGINAGIYEIEAYGQEVLTANPEPQKFVITGLTESEKTTSSFVLSWNAVDSKYLQEYRVYKGTTLYSSQIGTSLQMNALQSGSSCEYYVSAVDTFGVENPKSKLVVEIPKPEPPPPKPSLTGKLDGKNITLTFFADSTKIKQYDVYANNVFVASVFANEYKATLEANTITRYFVRATSVSGLQSESSNVYEAVVPIDPPKPPPVTESEQQKQTDQDGKGYMLVKWSATEGAVKCAIYLNGKKITEVGADQREYKITEAMGYKPNALNNVTDVRAILKDGTQGTGDNKSDPNVFRPVSAFGGNDVWTESMKVVFSLAGFLLLGILIMHAKNILRLLHATIRRH